MTKPSCRWAVLGLAAPTPDAAIPEDATTADILAWALVFPGDADPSSPVYPPERRALGNKTTDIIEAILGGVRAELLALTDTHRGGAAMSSVLLLLARRVHAAALLLRIADGRATKPPSDDEIDPEIPKAPSR